MMKRILQYTLKPVQWQTCNSPICTCHCNVIFHPLANELLTTEQVYANCCQFAGKWGTLQTAWVQVNLWCIYVNWIYLLHVGAYWEPQKWRWRFGLYCSHRDVEKKLICGLLNCGYILELISEIYLQPNIEAT
jgi:hypothetical protein